MLLNFSFTFVGFVDDKGQARDSFPQIRGMFSGNGVLDMDGDMVVKMKKR